MEAVAIFPKQVAVNLQYTPLLCIFFKPAPKSHYFHIEMPTIKHSSSLLQIMEPSHIKKRLHLCNILSDPTVQNLIPASLQFYRKIVIFSQGLAKHLKHQI
jgi:hypothetical protein